MVIISELPAGIQQQNFDRYHPEKVGGAVPIRFIPDKLEETKPEGKQSTVKIVISPTVKKSLAIFQNGNAKSAIELIQVHEYIVADKKLRVQYKANRVLVSSKNAKVKELKDKDEEDQVEIDKLNESITALKFTNVQLQEDMFDYF